MKPYEFTLTPQSDADGICQPQTPAAGGSQALTLNGVLGTSLNHAHIIEIVCTGNETSRTFTVAGEDDRGFSISEAVTGVSGGTASTTTYFKSITSITVDDDTAGTITVGVSGLCISKTYPLDIDINPFEVTLSAVLSNTLTYSFQYTLDDVQISTDLNSLNWTNHDVLVSKTASDVSNYSKPVIATRAKVTSWTSGTLTGRIAQAG